MSSRDDPLPQRERKRRRRGPDAAESNDAFVHAYKFVGRQREKQYEFLDHTADIQIHSWGPTAAAAFEEAAIAMFDYMTPLDYVEEEDGVIATGEVKGHDTLSLLFNFLDDLLYKFHVEDTVFKRVEVEIVGDPEPASSVATEEQEAEGGDPASHRLASVAASAAAAAGAARLDGDGARGSDAGDGEGYLCIKYRCHGAKMDLKRHPQGTEVKAITYSAMQVARKEDLWHLHVIVDI